MKRILIVGVMVAFATSWATAAAAKSPAETLLPPRVFGHLKHVRCVTDPRGDVGFFNGKPAGRHDAALDIVRACGATMDATAQDVTKIEANLPCGARPTLFVVCSPQGGGLPSGELVLFSMQVSGPIPLSLPVGDTARDSVFIDAGGDPATKSKATPEAPDVASQGTNVTYQLIFNDPGTTIQDVGILAVDRRAKNEFFRTNARVGVNGNDVIFVVPKVEIGTVKGLRGGTFLGSRAAQGDATRGGQDVVPGGRHASFGLIPYPG